MFTFIVHTGCTIQWGNSGNWYIVDNIAPFNPAVVFHVEMDVQGIGLRRGEKTGLAGQAPTTPVVKRTGD